jgi:hypothetical protein
MKRKHKILLQGFSLALILLVLPACEKNFLNINEDPNNPTDVPLTQLLPFAEVGLSNALSTHSLGLGEPAACFAHYIVTRNNFNSYFAQGNDGAVNDSWDQVYSNALTDLRQIIDIGTEDQAWNFVGAAQLLTAFAIGTMVDIWGDVPFKEANLGASKPYPAFDKGNQVYADLLKLIDEAIVNLGKTSNVRMGTADLYFAGDAAKWQRFGQTLKLRLYNQARLTPLYDDAAVKALLTGNKLMGAAADDFEMLYGNSVSPDTRHPEFIDEYTQNSPQHNISPYFYQIMQGKSQLNTIFNGIADPRIPYYFYNQLTPAQPAQNAISYRDGGFISIWFGSLNIDPNEGFDQNTSKTVVGLYPAGGKYDDGRGGTATLSSGLRGAGLHRMLTYFNSLYIRAELALTKSTGENAENLLKLAIEESFAEVNRSAASAGAPSITKASIDEYVGKILALYQAANPTRKLEIIMTQKWIANFGFSIEAYNDVRRTGFPLPFDPKTDNNPNTELVRNFIVSFPYPTTELQINPNAPKNQRVIATDKVFWDIN